MTVEEARRAYRLAALMDLNHPSWASEPPGACCACAYANLRAEAASVALDLAVAEHYSGRRCDGATQARREGVAWA